MSDAVKEEIINKVEMEMEMDALGPGGGVGSDDGGRDGVDSDGNLERVRVWSKWEKGISGKRKPNKREDENNRGKFWGKFKGLKQRSNTPL